MTPEGVTAKFNALYLLANTELELQAGLIRYGLKTWVFENFATTAQQETFIDSLSEGYLTVLAEQLARAVLHRWPVVYAPRQAITTLMTDKWVRSKEEDEAGDGPEGETGAHTGKLTITTGYN